MESQQRAAQDDKLRTWPFQLSKSIILGFGSRTGWTPSTKCLDSVDEILEGKYKKAECQLIESETFPFKCN